MKKWQLIVVVIMLVLIVVVIYLIKYFNFDAENEKTDKNQTDLVNEVYCNNDLDCVPASCCHPNSCVNKDFAPKCSGLVCSQVCAPGSLDCGQGSCLCINNKCNAVIK